MLMKNADDGDSRSARDRRRGDDRFEGLPRKLVEQFNGHLNPPTIRPDEQVPSVDEDEEERI
ncbi:MAG: hypothetical protein MZV70_16990 [Desulfobacterales bacterium]|nr:hypothetical protein [Desulfobacterales bacterium]